MYIKKSKQIFLFLFVLFVLIRCSESFPQINTLYKKAKSDYSQELVSHFPQKLPNKGVSHGGPNPAAAYAYCYWGFHLFINYDTEKELESYLQEIQDDFIDTVIFQSGNFISFGNIRDYCDSVQFNTQYSVYPYPDIQEQIKIQSEIWEEEIEHSTDWKDYTYYIIEQKDTIIFEEQKTNKCDLLEQELGHGYSRGIVLNEKDKILFYWLYFW
jgi:hypothetical protein